MIEKLFVAGVDVFRLGWFADDFESALRLLWVEAQDQRPAPGSQIDPPIGPGRERPGARALGRIKLPSLAGVRVHLHQEEQSAELIEIEIEGLPAATIRSHACLTSACPIASDVVDMGAAQASRPAKPLNKTLVLMVARVRSTHSRLHQGAGQLLRWRMIANAVRRWCLGLAHYAGRRSVLPDAESCNT